MSDRTGTTRSHLIREAIEARYGTAADREHIRRVLHATAGPWKDRAETGKAYVKRLRSEDRLGALQASGSLASTAPVSVLLDSSIIVDHLRGDERVVRLLEELFDADHCVWAATPTRTEVLAGIREAERDAMTALFGILSWVDIDAPIADAAGELARRYLRSHRGIGTTDYLIAAAAKSIGARLLTLHARHYPMFEDLRPAYW